MRERGRRYRAAGTPLRGRRGIGRRRQTTGDRVLLRGGNLVRSLTPRQAVVWLMHLDVVADKLPTAVATEFTPTRRARLARALRARISNREGFSRRRS